MGDLAVQVAQDDGGAAAPDRTPGRAPRRSPLDVPLAWLGRGRWAKFATLSPRQLARRCPGLAQWIAENAGGDRGWPCAAALALAMGVDE